MSNENSGVEGVAENVIGSVDRPPVEYEGSMVVKGAKKKRTRSPKVDDKVFISAWQCANSVQEAADNLGLKKASAQTKAVMFRKLGVELKKMPKGRKNGPQRNVEELKAYLASITE